MDDSSPSPWLPPTGPALARLALEAADAEGKDAPGPWPEVRGNGVAFGGLPTFLCWRFRAGGAWHLVLLQARELGALVPGARAAGLPGGWLRDLDLAALVRPLAVHPDFPGGARVHVLRVEGPGRARHRGGDPPAQLAEVLTRLTGTAAWEVLPEG